MKGKSEKLECKFVRRVGIEREDEKIFYLLIQKHFFQRYPSTVLRE